MRHLGLPVASQRHPKPERHGSSASLYDVLPGLVCGSQELSAANASTSPEGLSGGRSGRSTPPAGGSAGMLLLERFPAAWSCCASGTEPPAERRPCHPWAYETR